MKFIFFVYVIQFCINRNQLWHKQRIIHDTIHGNDKSVDKSHRIAQSTDTNERSIPQAQILRSKFPTVYKNLQIQTNTQRNLFSKSLWFSAIKNK